MHSEKELYEFSIGADFFKQYESSLVNEGELKALVEVKKNTDSFDVRLSLNGFVVVSCDRCLGDLKYPVNSVNDICVKFGPRNEETELYTMVDLKEGMLDADTLIYDYAVLSVPIHPTHAEGECNEAMVKKLKEYMISEEPEQ